MLAVKDFDELPAMMTGEDIARALGVSRATGYNIMKKSSFPVVRIGTKRFVVKKTDFLRWLDHQIY